MFKIDKKHIQGFIAGIVVVAILLAGAFAVINPSFLFGSMTNSSYISDAELDDIVNNTDTSLLLFFYAEWSGPCKTLSPIIEEIKSEYGDHLKVVRISVDSNISAAAKFNISSVPALVLLDDGIVKSV